MYMNLNSHNLLFGFLVSEMLATSSATFPTDNLNDIFSDDFIALLHSNDSHILLSEQFASISPLLFTDSKLEMFLKSNFEFNYRSTIITAVGSIHEAMDILAKLSRNINNETNEIIRHNMQRIQVFFAIQIINETVKASETEVKIKSKLDLEVVSTFDLASSILFGFYSQPTEVASIIGNNSTVNLDLVQFDIWELYCIKSVPFVKQISQVVSGKNLETFLLLDSRRVSRRQDWQGIEIVGAPFIVAGIVEQEGSFTEIEGVTKFEVNLKRNLQTGEYNLKPSLSARIFWDFELSLNFTGKVTRPFTYTSDFVKVIKKQGHKFDIIISHFTLVPNKFKFAHHLSPTYFNGISAFFVQPPAHAFRNIYTTPFSLELWKMIAITWMVIGLSFKITQWIRSGMSTFVDCCSEEEEERDELVTSESFWWVIAALCQQGWFVTPSTTPSRIIFATGLVFSFLCYAAYTARIVSELWDTVTPIRSLESLIENSRDIFVAPDSDIGDIVVEGFIQRNHKYLSKIKRRDSTPALFHHLLHAGQGKSCFLNWPEYFIDYAKQVFEANTQHGTPSNVEVQFCEKFTSYPYKYIPVKAAMFVHKMSPFLKFFNFRILISGERGLLRRYWNEYLQATDVRCLVNANKTYALGIYDTWGVFAVLITGYAISLSILSMEIIFRRQRMIFAITK